MKKIFAKIACALIVCSCIQTSSIAFAANTERTNDKYTIIQNYKIIDDDVSEISFYGNLNNSSINSDIMALPIPGTRYRLTEYTVTNTDLLTYNAKPIENETFLISVPEGYSLKLSTSKTVSGSLSIIAGAEKTTAETKAISKKFSLTGSATGSISKTFTKEEVFEFPPSYTGIYRTANFYAAVSYDYYKITIEAKDLYVNIIGQSEYKNERTYYVYAYIPKIIMYTKGANY